MFYGGSDQVTVDLSLATDTAKRGSETDTLTNVEGAIGSSAGDVLQGQPGATTTSKAGAARTPSPAAAAGTSTTSMRRPTAGRGDQQRDVVTDFVHQQDDDLDLMGVDADTRLAGDQASAGSARPR